MSEFAAATAQPLDASAALETRRQLRQIVELSQNARLRELFLACVVILGWLSLDVLIHILTGSRALQLGTAYCLPLFGVVVLARVSRVARQSPHPAPRAAAGLGVLLIAGAAIFDLGVTLWKSPGLAEEANIYIRVLLDSGHSLPFVYAHTFVTQGVFVLLFCGFWLAFLRHLPLLIADLSQRPPRSRLQFLKAATGGAELTFREWLLPLRLSELPHVYHNLWLTSVLVISSTSLFRLYAGVEWLEFVEPSLAGRATVFFGSLLLCGGLYLRLLAARVRRSG